MSPSLGVRLLGTEQDVATLWAVADSAPELVSAPWVEHALPSGSVLWTDPLSDAALVMRLRERGVALAAVPAAPGRRAAHLAEAARPVPLPGDPPCALAWLLVDRERPSARDTLERLLLLGRDDVRMSVLEQGAAQLLLVEVKDPPLYLLMRARQEDEGVRAYASVGSGLFVEWGFAHPLPMVAQQVAQRAGATLLIDRDGRWRSAPEKPPFVSIYDGLVPELDAPSLDLVPSPGEHRFHLRVRLGPAPEGEPELWLLDPKAFAALEDLLDATPADQLAGLTVCRLEEPGLGVRYLLRERHRPGMARMGPRLSGSVGQPGFVRVTGTDNLYLPDRRRLLPALRRDDLRAMLELDRTKLVLIEEDARGPRVLRVADLHEQPITAWMELVALDRRVELDRLVEEALFQIPHLQIEPRPQPRPVVEPPQPERPRKPVKRPPSPPRRAPQRPVAEVAPQEEPEREEIALLRQRAAVYEDRIGQGGCEDGAVWAELGQLKIRLDERHDASLCLEAAAFHAGLKPDLVQTLVGLRERLAEEEVRALSLAELALRETLPGPAASLLGARVLERLISAEARGRALDDGLVPHLVELFSDPSLPVSRRLAWTVLRECHAATADRLGLTRAREAVLGGLNTAGLSEAHDVPHFVRQQLALGEQGLQSGVDQGDRLALLDELWRGLPDGGELDVLSTFQCAIFAVGFVRLGATGQARALVDRVEAELSAHDPPNRALFRLYLARISTPGALDEEPWKAELARIQQSLDGDAEAWRIAEWFCKRSSWLKSGGTGGPEPWVRPLVSEVMAKMEAAPERAHQELEGVMRSREPYDYEIEVAVQCAVRAVLGTGQDELIAELVQKATARIDSISSLFYRIRAIGACLRGAAAAQDLNTVQQLLDKIVDIAHAQDAPSIRSLLTAVRPALAALRPLGAGEAAGDFLRAMIPTSRTTAEVAPLLASLAEGFVLQREWDQADQLLQRAVDATVAERVSDYADRDAAGEAVLAALRHWPVRARGPLCRRLLAHLPLFRDAFAVRRYFPTYQLLLLERLVDTVVDEAVVSTDRVRAFLDEEELVIRRQIHADWNGR